MAESMKKVEKGRFKGKGGTSKKKPKPDPNNPQPPDTTKGHDRPGEGSEKEAKKYTSKGTVEAAKKKVAKIAKQKAKVKAKRQKAKKAGNKNLAQKYWERKRELNKRLAKARRVKYTTPGREGVATPPMEPEFSVEELREIAAMQSELDDAVNQLNYEFEEMLWQTRAEQEARSAEAVKQSRAAADEYAARGLQRSAIRTRDLDDITATARLQNSNLEAALNAARMRLREQVGGVDEAGEFHEGSLQTAFNNQLRLMEDDAAARAAELGKNAPEWQVEPVAAKEKLLKLAVPKVAKNRKQKPKKPGVQTGKFQRPSTGRFERAPNKNPATSVPVTPTNKTPAPVGGP